MASSTRVTITVAWTDISGTGRTDHANLADPPAGSVGMSPHRRRALRDERGFTLVEIIVTMTLALVVLFAILGASEIFGTSVTTVEQRGRRAGQRPHDHSQHGRHAAPGSLRAGPDHPGPRLVDAVAQRPRDRGVRHDAAGTGDRAGLGALLRGRPAARSPRSSWASASATPIWRRAPARRPTRPTGGRHAVVLDRTLQGPAQLFDFSSSSCTGSPLPARRPDVQAVGIRARRRHQPRDGRNLQQRRARRRVISQ